MKIIEKLEYGDLTEKILSYKNHPNLDNLVIHMSDTDKIGINPHKTHGDPHGIYCYPLSYYIDMLSSDSRFYLPYRSSSLWMYIIQINKPLLKFTDLNKLSNDQFNLLLEELNIQNKEIYHRGNASKFWFLISLMGASKPYKLFLNSEYAGVFDNGLGIIHPNEPYQIVIFSTKISIIDKIKNKNYSETGFNSLLKKIMLLFKINKISHIDKILDKFSSENILKMLESDAMSLIFFYDHIYSHTLIKKLITRLDSKDKEKLKNNKNFLLNLNNYIKAYNIIDYNEIIELLN